MALKDFFKTFFGNKQVDTNTIRQALPFVHLFGTEKSYGVMGAESFPLMVDQYKSWVYACAWKNATSVAKNKVHIFKKRIIKDNVELEIVNKPDHPFLKVINEVNPFSNRFELFTITQINLELTGNGYWWMPKNVLRLPYMIWNIPSHWMTVVPSKREFIAGYIMTVPGRGEKVPFDEDEIVHFKFPSPFSLYYGLGPTWAAQYGIDLNNNIKRWGINYFTNNAQPSGVLTTDQAINPDLFQRLRDQWNQKFRGPKNAGKIALLQKGLKYQQTGSTIRDARFELVSQDIRNEILAMFGIPASKLGLVEDVNRANADANDYTYQKETIEPRLLLIEEKINEKIIPIYDDTLVAKFENPVPEDKEFTLKEMQTNIASGLTTIDEERIKRGLDPFKLPETSKPLIPFNLVPAGEEKPDMGFGPPPDNSDKDAKSKKLEKSRASKWRVFASITQPHERKLSKVMQRFFQSQHGQVMRNLNNIKTVKKDMAAQILFNMQEENEKLGTLINPSVRSSFVAGLSLGMADTGTGIDLDLFEPNIVRAVNERASFFAEKVNQSTADAVRNEINQALTNGETIEQISKRVDSIFDFSEKFRSRRVAQTEVIGATNSGQLKAYAEAGVEEKQWITARDERVRESHQIDGQKVDLNDPFTTGLGNPLQYPGDRSTGAPAEEVINCRCTVLAVF